MELDDNLETSGDRMRRVVHKISSEFWEHSEKYGLTNFERGHCMILVRDDIEKYEYWDDPGNNEMISQISNYIITESEEFPKQYGEIQKDIIQEIYRLFSESIEERQRIEHQIEFEAHKQRDRVEQEFSKNGYGLKELAFEELGRRLCPGRAKKKKDDILTRIFSKIEFAIYEIGTGHIGIEVEDVKRKFANIICGEKNEKE